MLVAGQINIIVGVLPPGFRFRISLIPREPHVWQSVSVALQQGAGRWFNPLARLKPGISVEQARLELEAISQHLEERDSTSDESWRPDVRLLPDVLFASWKESLFLLSGIALLVLLIGCANVANLLLARARKREKEISIRISMGASRLRLIRQLLTESILLAALGGILGLFFTFWGIGFFVALAPRVVALCPGGYQYRWQGARFCGSSLTSDRRHLRAGAGPSNLPTQPVRIFEGGWEAFNRLGPDAPAQFADRLRGEFDTNPACGCRIDGPQLHELATGRSRLRSDQPPEGSNLPAGTRVLGAPGGAWDEGGPSGRPIPGKNCCNGPKHCQVCSLPRSMDSHFLRAGSRS